MALLPLAVGAAALAALLAGAPTIGIPPEIELKIKLEELQRQLDKCREEHRVTKGELEECEKEGFQKSLKHKLELAKCKLEKEQLKAEKDELERQLDKCREEHRVTKGELEECEKEGFNKSLKHKLELAKRNLEKEKLEAEKDELERQLEGTRKAALVFMAAADTYQEDAEKLIKAKVEELENTRKASVAFMDAADRYEEAARKQIRAKEEELEDTRKAALLLMDAADTYQEAGGRRWAAASTWVLLGLGLLGFLWFFFWNSFCTLRKWMLS